MRGVRRSVVAAAAIALSGSAPRAAHADAPRGEAVDPTTAARALALYDEGRQLLHDGETQAALDRFAASEKLLPSPNTELLVGHALRLLKRRVEAMRAYERVVDAAGARVRAGEDRFRATLVDAGRWIALLRAELCEIALVVTHPPADARVTVDGEDVGTAVQRKVDAASGTITARLWHEPGRARFAVQGAAGELRETQTKLPAGGTREVRLDFGEPPPPPPPPTRSTESWIATGSAAGVGVVGLGLFVVFKVRAEAAANTLRDCSPCPHNKENDDARDVGKTSTTIANVSLAVTGAAAIATGLFWWFGRAEAPAKAGAPPRPIELGIGAGGVQVRGAL